MFITRKHLSRRTLLRGMGVGLSLPLLDAMIPAATALAGTAAAPKPRLGFFYFPHGAVMENWTPEGEGRDFKLRPISEPLAPFRNQLTILSNLGNKPGESRAVHALVPATWLSCVHPQEGLEPSMAATVDSGMASTRAIMSRIRFSSPGPKNRVMTRLESGLSSMGRRFTLIVMIRIS